MTVMLLGLAGLAAAALLAYMVQRHQDLLRLQAQSARARAVLEGVLRQRKELVQVWCSLCEERGLLADWVPQLRKALGRLEEVPVSGDRLGARWQEEKRMSRVIRESYASFLDGMGADGAHREFFQQYFRSLTRLETEMGDAHELYNDSVRAFNAALEGWSGWYFRHWDRLRPKPALPPAADEPRPRGTEEGVPSFGKAVSRAAVSSSPASAARA
jgi:hypothetical protein